MSDPLLQALESYARASGHRSAADILSGRRKAPKPTPEIPTQWWQEKYP